MEQSKGGNVTKLLQCWSAGDKGALEQLTPPGIPETAKTRCGLPAGAGANKPGRTFEELLALIRKQSIYAMAISCVSLGYLDKAFAWYEKAYEERSESLLYIKTDPNLDRYHADPRYQSLVRRIGLSP